jgi:xanthine dehydrogenase YagT iron-sulfur-binding subunit
MDGRTVFSCTILAVEAEGKCIETIEGLASGSDLNPLQKAFIKNDALQCGYCIPAMLMAATALLRVKMEPTEDDVRQGIAGVYCRCGAYPNIVRAVLDVSRGQVDC